MTDHASTAASDALSNLRPMMDGSGANTAQQIGIEADRLRGTVRDGVEAAQAASKNYAGLLTDAYVRMIQGSVRNGVDFGNHALALLQARTPADVMRINVEFVQKQMSSVQGRFFELAGLQDASPDRVERM